MIGQEIKNKQLNDYLNGLDNRSLVHKLVHAAMAYSSSRENMNDEISREAHRDLDILEKELLKRLEEQPADDWRSF